MNIITNIEKLCQHTVEFKQQLENLILTHTHPQECMLSGRFYFFVMNPVPTKKLIDHIHVVHNYKSMLNR